MKLKNVPADLHAAQLESLLEKLQDETVDTISHFILRLAFCRTEEFRRWFLTHETALMKIRLGMASSSTNASAKALASILPEAKLLNQTELDALLPLILAATPTMTLTTTANQKFYAVPFTHALDLISSRQVLVRHGLAYIPQSKLLNLVTAKFRMNLSKHLALLSSVPVKDPRTKELVSNLATISMTSSAMGGDGSEYETSDLTAATVQAHLKHMPLCMVNLQLGLKQDKKLKHWGRLQYGLFLKGAGLSLEEAFTYFERQFASTNFQKDYGYNIRHMYGKEGARKSYPPYSCAKIIHGPAPNANEHHGCPYRHATVQQVTHLLSKLGISPQDQTNIVTQQKSHQYQLACVEHFRRAHPSEGLMKNASMDNVGNHPNAWFAASLAHAKAMGTAPTTTPTGGMAPEQSSSGVDSQRAAMTTAVSP